MDDTDYDQTSYYFKWQNCVSVTHSTRSPPHYYEGVINKCYSALRGMRRGEERSWLVSRFVRSCFTPVNIVGRTKEMVWC